MRSGLDSFSENVDDTPTNLLPRTHWLEDEQGLDGDDLKTAALRSFRSSEKFRRGDRRNGSDSTGKRKGRREDAHRRLPEALDWHDDAGDDGATERFSTDRRRFRSEATRWGLPVLDVEVGEDDGDVGYLLVPSAWTEELHGELSTAARLR